MLLSLGVTVKFCGVIAGVDQVFNSTHKIPAAFEVQRKLRRELRGALAIMQHELFARLLMKRYAALVDEVAVKKVLIQRMRETITGRQRAVRQFFLAESVDQAVRLADLRQQLFEIDFVDSKEFRSDCRKKLRTFNTGILQRAALLSRQRIDLLADHRAHALGRFQI